MRKACTIRLVKRGSMTPKTLLALVLYPGRDTLPRGEPRTKRVFCFSASGRALAKLMGLHGLHPRNNRAPTVGDGRRGATPLTVAGGFNSGAWGRLKGARPDTAKVNQPFSTQWGRGWFCGEHLKYWI